MADSDQDKSLAGWRRRLGGNGSDPAGGVLLLFAIVAVMWLVEVVNALDANRLDSDGLYARNLSRIWGILTSPFIHASFAHLADNSVPLLLLGLIIAAHGARRLAVVTGLIIVIGGLGTWLISPGGVSTIGASGVVFGYATYLMARGFFDRKIWELGVGLVVGVIWGWALLSSLIPHAGISWQGHVCGAIAGVLVAWRFAAADRQSRAAAVPGSVA
ncbi:MAG: rhomboid family intramembrane serine protease [Solirubrobacteraceae bacterium]